MKTQRKHTLKKWVTTSALLSVAATASHGALIGHWALDGNANDSSASGANGIENGTITYTTGVAGMAVVADAGNILATAAEITTQTGYQSFTISAWFREDDASFSQPLGMRLGDDGWEFQTNIGGQAIVQAAVPSPWTLTWTQALTSDGNTWNHLVYTFDSTTGATAMYVNGALSTDPNATNVAPGVFDAAIDTINIGGSNYTGDIDDVQLYDEVLSASQVAFLNANPGVAVPEPSSSALLGLAGLALILRRRK